MNTNEYKEKMFKIIEGYPKQHRGVKYIRNWDTHWSEKNYYVDKIDWSHIKTALDVGTGVGMTPFILQQKGIDVEGSDIPEALEIEDVFRKCCDLIKLKRHPVTILNNKPTVWPKEYDILLAQRTEFDREALPKGERFNWMYFLEDVFKNFNEVYIKCNASGKACPGRDTPLDPYFFNPRITEGLGKPYRAWYLHINKEQWLNIHNN